MSKSRALSNGDFGVIFASRKCSKEQAHLMIHHSSKISCGGSNGNLCSRSEGSGESAHLHRLAWAFVTVSESHVHARSAVCVSFMQAVSYMTSANALVSLHIRTGSTEPLSLYQNLLRWLKWRLVSYLYEQRRLWRVCTSKYNNGVQPSLRYFNAHFKVMKILNKTFIKKMSFHGGIMLPMLSSI